MLTTRGRAFIAAGATLVLCGMALGFADLTRVGVLLVGLPLMCAVLARRARADLTVTRTVTPARLPVDEQAQVELRFEGGRGRPTAVQLADERIDYVLGDRPRFVLPRMDRGDVRQVVYQVRSHVRGRHRIGPLTLRVRDPFGLATSAVVVPGAADVLVLPKVEPLAGSRLRGDGVGAEGAIPHMVALHGEDDVSIRGYRDGDDLRRIHWPATAHRGELMVRQEDRPARRRAVLVLDSRGSGHRGTGGAGSFEWAVTALASVAVHLSEQGYAVHLVSAETVAEARAVEVVDVDSALAALAVADLAPDASFDRVLHEAAPLSAAGGMVLAVVTDHDEEMVRRLAALRQPGGSGLLLMLAAGSFAGTAERAGEDGTTALAELVLGAGWSAVVVRAGTTVPQAWAGLTATSGVSLVDGGRLVAAS
ncbi:MAG TPA: DUF58 domain-containing protein [Dermatophilaceae bacterium]|nr:DUF58 domain-containing protein [Dermatophilaceae bacterium]